MLRYVIAFFLCVFGCVLIALFYRPTNTYLSQVLLEWAGDDFLHLRTHWQERVPLNATLVYNLPGALWIFSLSLLGWRLHFSVSDHRLSLFPLGLLTGVGFELTQYLGFTDGTADWLDLAWNLTGFAAGWAFCQTMPRQWRAEPGYWRYVLYFVVFFAAFVVDVV